MSITESLLTNTQTTINNKKNYNYEYILYLESEEFKDNINNIDSNLIQSNIDNRKRIDKLLGLSNKEYQDIIDRRKEQ